MDAWDAADYASRLDKAVCTDVGLGQDERARVLLWIAQGVRDLAPLALVAS